MTGCSRRHASTAGAGVRRSRAHRSWRRPGLPDRCGWPARGSPRRCATNSSGDDCVPSQSVCSRAPPRQSCLSRGRDDEVALAVVDAAFGVEGVEHFLLVRVRPNLEAGQRDGHVIARSAAAPRRARLRAGRDHGPGRSARRTVGPVLVERPPGTCPAATGSRQPRGARPLDAVEQGCPRQVGRADVRGVGAGVAPEQPRLGVQPGTGVVVLRPGPRHRIRERAVSAPRSVAPM